jgi:hypothetical protein
MWPSACIRLLLNEGPTATKIIVTRLSPVLASPALEDVLPACCREKHHESMFAEAVKPSIEGGLQTMSSHTGTHREHIESDHCPYSAHCEAISLREAGIMPALLLVCVACGPLTVDRHGVVTNRRVSPQVTAGHIELFLADS